MVTKEADVQMETAMTEEIEREQNGGLIYEY